MSMEATLDPGSLATAWNYCGERMAVALDDGSLQIWDKQKANARSLYCAHKWKAHSDSIFKVVWGPPEYGDIIACCSKDGAISLWEEIVENKKCTWRRCALFEDPAVGMLDVQFGNCLSGLKLVAAGNNGLVKVYEALDSIELKNWQLQAEFPNVMNATEKIGKCQCSAASISWKPSVGPFQQPIFALGYCAHASKFSTVKVWEFLEAQRRWYPVAELVASGEKVGDVNAVSWAPNIGRPYEMIAVVTGSVVSIWHLELQGKRSVKCVAQLTQHDGEVWEADWDMSGMTLATSCDDGLVRVWQAGLDGTWRQQAVLQGHKE